MIWQQQKGELENPRPSDRKVHQGYQKEQLGQHWCGTLPVVSYHLPHLIVLQHGALQSANGCIFLHDPRPDMGFDAAP